MPAVVPYMRVSTQEVRADHAWISRNSDCVAPVGLGYFYRMPGRGPPQNRRLSRAQPLGLLIAIQPSPTALALFAPIKTTTVVDRHPLFSKPRDYWETSGDNKVVKAAAATFVGVPVGIYGEFKQIIVGAPPEAQY